MNNQPQSFVDEFRSRIARNSTMLVLWFITLGLIWILNLSSIPELLDNLEKAKRVVERYSGTSSLVLKNLKDKEIAERAKALDIKFKLPGFEFTLKAYIAPAAWNILTLITLLQLYIARKSLFSLSARAIRYNNLSTQSTKTNQLSSKQAENSNDVKPIDVIGIVSWWLAPLPSIDGSHVNSECYRKALGWRIGQTYSLYFVLALFAVVLCAQIHVCYLSFIASSKLISNDLNLIPKIISSVSFIVSLFIIYRWFQQNIVPDFTFEEERLNSISKREFLVASLASVTVGASVVFFGTREINLRGLDYVEYPSLNPNFLRSPRYAFRKIHRNIKTKLNDGFYSNPESQVVHLITNNGLLRSNSSVRIQRLKKHPVEEILRLDPKIHTGLSLINIIKDIERHSLKLIGNGDITKACNLLLLVIKYDLNNTSLKKNYRVYDLLASLAVRYQLLEHLSDLLSAIMKEKDDVLLNRAKKWNDKDSKWYLRLSDKTKEFKWAGVVV